MSEERLLKGACACMKPVVKGGRKGRLSARRRRLWSLVGSENEICVYKEEWVGKANCEGLKKRGTTLWEKKINKSSRREEIKGSRTKEYTRRDS